MSEATRVHSASRQCHSAVAVGTRATADAGDGYLSGGSLQTDNIPGRLIAFQQSLNEMGYVEGQNLAIEYRWAEGQYDQLPALAANLVHRQVNVIFATGSPPAFAAKAATAAIPVVFNIGADPVQSGLVSSLNRPGGNVTGVVILSAELAGKGLDLLHQLVPTAAAVALLVNPTNLATPAETNNWQEAAHSLGLQLNVLPAATATEIDAAFGSLEEHPAGALAVATDQFFASQRALIVALAARRALPAIYIYREFAEVGGLMSYGTDLADGYRQGAVLTAKVLRGAKPADLPVQQVVNLKLIINLSTVKALGLTVPSSILGRADEVIE